VAALLAATVLLAAAVLPTAAGFTPLLVTSGSMGRAAPVGSVVLGRGVDAAQVRVGDVVLLPRPDTPVLHRVIETQRDQGKVVVRTKGDANADPDSQPTVLPLRVVRAVWTVHHVGHALWVVKTPLGWVLFVLAPAAALTALFLLRVWTPPAAAANASGWSLTGRGVDSPSQPHQGPDPPSEPDQQVEPPSESDPQVEPPSEPDLEVDSGYDPPPIAEYPRRHRRRPQRRATVLPKRTPPTTFVVAQVRRSLRNGSRSSS